ncbi:MAG: OsmC family protein [Roseiflexaceae bacterium]|jgi:uncharacterized OsmC-like protein|nr:MAG: hypothetical protein DWI54_01085 [Chloroflexota bacterium]RLT33448.1 MAG: hypothetical protein DWI55_02710 [Chloroflexota bacterium]
MQYVFAQTYRAFPSPSGMIWSDVDITHQGPMQLLITALVRCTILTLDSIIIKQRNSVTSYRIEVHAQQRLAHPQLWESVALSIHCARTTCDHASLERALHIVPRYCPVHATIAQTTDLSHQIAIDTTAEDVT